MAFERRLTILELFVDTIKKCFLNLMAIGAIPNIPAAEKERQWAFG